MAAPIEVRLKSDPHTGISAAAIDERSTETLLALVGLKGEIVVIARENIAMIVMDADAANEFFDTLFDDADAEAAT